ncbi:hypothetical protein [Streptomyces sp. NBRC 110035]|uniref:hypothetical protein n=1 Tax=unclassified Streptomyces TaxID=2593676 RepID=UPI00131B46A3
MPVDVEEGRQEADRAVTVHDQAEPGWTYASARDFTTEGLHDRGDRELLVGADA